MNAPRVFSILFTLCLTGVPGWAQDSSEGCSVCHRTHYKQWLQSPHALAWKSPEFQAQMKTFGSPEFCGRCHAPASIWRQVNMRPAEGETAPEDFVPELLKRPATAREVGDEGVNCASCHFIEVLWPWGDADETVGPYHTERGHQGRPAEAFESFRLCGTCHGRERSDYRPSGVSEGGGFYHNQNRAFEFAVGESDCTVCHMPASQAKLTQLSVFKNLPERTVREHTFIGNRYQKLADHVDFALQPDGALLITNRGVGHPIRVKLSTALVLEVTQIRDGRPVGETTLDFPIAPELGAGASRLIPLHLELEKGDSVRTELIRRGPGDFRESLLEKRLDVQ